MHSVQDFVDAAFGHAGLDPEGHVVVDPALLRPAEVDKLVADPTLAREQLGWTPETSFAELVAMMVDADVERLSTEPASAPGAAGSLASPSFGEAERERR